MSDCLKFTLSILIYIIIVLISYFYKSPFHNEWVIDSDDLEPVYPHPTVGKLNSTKVLTQRFAEVRTLYESKFKSTNWKLLRSNAQSTVMVESLEGDSEDKW